VLAAADDPMIPSESVAGWSISPSVRREIAPTGGHVGFVGPSQAPGWFWAPDRALDFLEPALSFRGASSRRATRNPPARRR